MADSVSTLKLQPIVAVSGRDPEAMAAAVARLYVGDAWQARPSADGFWFKYVGIGDEQASIRRWQEHGHLRGEMATGDDVVVQWLDRGRARVNVGRDEIQMRAGVPVLLPVDRRFEIEYGDWDMRLVHLRRDFLLDVASEHQLVNGPLAFDDGAEPDARSVATWRSSVAGAVRVLHSDGPASLAWYEARRELALSLLQLYPLRNEQHPLGHGQPGQPRLRAAVNFVHAHAHEPLTVSGIAAAAGLSARGLQDAFQRSLECTPMGYLRQVRLDRVHEQLRTCEPGITLVGDVARQWGFAHMGRFSSAYAERFGEYPRQTLRRPGPSEGDEQDSPEALQYR